jgi:hypothetical protein
VRIIYHSQSLSLTTAGDLAVANFDRSRWAKSRTSPGSFLRSKAILRCKSIVLEAQFSCFIKVPLIGLVFSLSFNGDSWRVDETYIKVRGQWVFFIRAVDKESRIVDFLLSKGPDVTIRGIELAEKIDQHRFNPGPRTGKASTAAREGKSGNFRLRKITDRSRVDGPASTTNNSLCAWLAIVSAPSKWSPRQKAATQSRSQERLTAILQEVQRKRMARAT